MESKITVGRPAADESKPVKCNEAENLGGYTLAAWWSDRTLWPMPGEEDASDELAELACMSALARWLSRWRPIPIHRAVLAGAEPEAIAAAFGGSIAEAFGCWHEWATEQRDYGRPGVTDEEYDAVARVFAAAGVTVHEGPRRD